LSCIVLVLTVYLIVTPADLNRFKVIQGHPFRRQAKARMRLRVNEHKPGRETTYILSRAVSESSQSIDQIIALRI